MIYTVTFNPAIDYVVRMKEELLPGMTNRSQSEEVYFGGKGINVSTVLRNLGIDSTALGFVAGFTGAAIKDSVRSKGISENFITLPQGLTRINVKIKGLEETEINGQGPQISDEAYDELLKKLDKLEYGDVLRIGEGLYYEEYLLAEAGETFNTKVFLACVHPVGNSLTLV